jgi:exodeoxyribonuclease V gamma subunit
MTGIHLHRSNRLEALASALVAATRTPLRSVLTSEIVVVQSLGMRRWLQQELAQRAGVAMNVDFPFPAEFTDEILRAAVPDAPRSSGFSRDVLPWRVLGLFPQVIDSRGFEELRSYTTAEPRALKEYQLAHRIAATFDRYIAYRPQMLLEWQAGRETHWQAQLWRELVRGHEETNPPALFRALAARLRSGRVDEAGLPERVGVFGISSLPPIYIELLGALAGVIEVHLFLLEPTADYWADLLSPRERDREALRRKLRELPEDEEPELSGNDLLASLCKTGRDFAWLLLDRLDARGDDECFVAPDEATLLGQLQADIFQLREPEERRPIADGDHSLQVHCCHGPMRELEVLHDRLLALFESMPGLTPRDILVTMPDVETYAPFIDAVFGAPESDSVCIPYSIADRAASAESSVADTFLRVLSLVGSRFAAPEVLALFDAPAVRARFDLAESDLPLIRKWIERTAIRWGIDAAHRTTFDLPAFSQNSWRAGLDRLLLGYALPGDGDTLFGGVLPEPGIEGSLAITLGAFVECVERLFRHAAGLAAPRPPADWERALRAVLDDFFDAGDAHADEVRRVSAALETFAHTTAEAGFDAALDFAAVRAHLTAALADTESSPGFLAGRVTFCALKPMRSIPFGVVCLLGLNDTAFPRHEQPPGFDLAAQRPRRGDRSLREDDRYLFLEALLSARETLYLSYSGLSVRDNSESPPSVLVSELLDYLARHFDLPKDFVIKHRLQPFSPAYFTGADARLFSYSVENAAAAQEGAAARETAISFAGQALPEPGAEWRDVTLDQLTDFLSHPARYFLRKRLGVRLPGEERPLGDSEPEGLDTLETHLLRGELTERSVAAGTLTANLPAARASGVLPPGYAGDSAYGAISREVDALLARIGPALAEPALPPLPFAMESDGWRLSGSLTDVRPSALVRYRAAKLKARDRVRTWVAHLALQLAARADHPRVTIFHSTDTAFSYPPLPDANEILAELLRLYARGLRAPVPFFPETSWEFAEHTVDSKSDPMKAARRKWEGGNSGHSESEDGWNALAFRGVEDPLDAVFQEVALTVTRPIFAATEELE